MPTFERINIDDHRFQEPPSNKFKQFLQNFHQYNQEGPKYVNTNNISSFPENHHPQNGVFYTQAASCNINNTYTRMRNEPCFINNTNSCLIRDPYHCQCANGNVSCNVNEPPLSARGNFQAPHYISSVHDEEDKLISRLESVRPNLGQIKSCQINRGQNSSEFIMPQSISTNSGKCIRQSRDEIHQNVKQQPKLISNQSLIQNQIINKCDDHYPAKSVNPQLQQQQQPPPHYCSINHKCHTNNHKCHINDEILNKRHSNKILMMSCISPGTNWNKHSIAGDPTIKPRRSTKKRKKGKRDTNLVEMMKNSEREFFQGNSHVEFQSKDLNDEIRHEDTAHNYKDQSEGKEVFVSNDKSNLTKDISATSLVQFIHYNNNDPLSVTKRSNATTSQINFNYNSGNSEIPDDQRRNRETTQQQSNNNSIPNGSIVSMARELLKKNCFQGSQSKNGQPCEMYTIVEPGFDESDEESQVRKKISERWLRLTQSGDQNQLQSDHNSTYKASKISRSSLNTFHTQTSDPDNVGDPSQLVTIPESGVLSTSKKSRMYISNNLHLRRLYQPAGVVSYLTQKYKHRQPKLCEGGQGYDQTVRNVVKNLHDSWLDQSQCDVAIVTDDGEIMAHQAVLSSFSPSLAALFKANKPNSEMENNPDIPHPILMINMSEFSKDVIADTLHFLYTTDIKLDITNVSQFVLVARRLELPVLSKICDDYILNSCNLDSLLLHFLIANNCDLTDIATNLEMRIAQNFEILWTKKHVVKLSRSLLLGILNHPHLSISEINKFHVVAKWLEYNKSERIKYVCDLMKLVDFEKIEINSLLSTVKNLDWMFTNETMRTKMLNAYKSSVDTSNSFYATGKYTNGRNSNIDMKNQEKDSKAIPLEDLFHSSSCSPFAQVANSRNDFNKNKTKTQHGEGGNYKPHCDSPSKGAKENQMTSKPVRQKDPFQRAKSSQSPLQGGKVDEPTKERALAAMSSFPVVANKMDLRHRQNSRESNGKRCQHQISNLKHYSQGTSPLRSSPQHQHRTRHHNHLVNVGTSPSPGHRCQDKNNDNAADNGDENDNDGDGSDNGGDDDDDEYMNDMKSQGIVSLFLPNYRPPPFKKYQLTNSTNAKYVEI